MTDSSDVGKPMNELSATSREAVPSAPDRATETLRAEAHAAHRDAPGHLAMAKGSPAERAVLAEQREVLRRMSRTQLEDYLIASAHGPSRAAANLKEASDQVREHAETATRRASAPPLEERFNVVSTAFGRYFEFKNQPGRVAFSESLLSLRSNTDSPAAVRAMVERAAERGWATVTATGSDEFKRLAWIAATAKGIRTRGYEPTSVDRQDAERERTRNSASNERQAAAPDRASLPAGAAAHRTDLAAERQPPEALYAAIEKALVDGKVPAALRAAVRDRLLSEGRRRASRGERIKIAVYDPQAPRATRKVVTPSPQRHADRERSR